MMHRYTPLLSVCAALVSLLMAPGASAEEAPPTLFGRPVSDPPALTPEQLERRALEFRETLERQGLVLKDNQVLPRSALEPLAPRPEAPTEAWDKPPHRATMFLNFFGGPLKNGDNASEGESPCVGNNIMYPGFKGGEQKALAVIQVFKDAAAPFGLRIAYDKVPPKHLPYSQVMMGGRPGIIGLPGGVLGVACNLDCGDLWWRDTTFAFTEESNNIGVLGTTALQEAAHAWGLDHIDGANNIMYPYATQGIKVWADTCTPFNDETGGIACTTTHEKFCADGQNDIAELTAFFGPDSPDTEPPTVTMVSPTDGQQYSKGDRLLIEVDIRDNFEGFGWRLMVPELKQEQPVYNGQTKWDLPVPPDGTYTIRVEAIDHDRNVGFAEAKIHVGPVPGPDSGEEPTGGPDSGASSGEPESSGSSGEDVVEADGEEGCACASDAPISASAWLLVLVGGLLPRRRARV